MMDSKKLKQIVNQINKQLDSWDIDKWIKHSNDEAQTRDNLIHPFFNLLNYDKVDDYTHEYVADLNHKRSKKVDIAITLGKNQPCMLVECKKATINLNDNHYRQLREYCADTPSCKIGILTNGIEYKFYIKDNNGLLRNGPFFVFNISNYVNSDLDLLALFYKQGLEINEIIKEAEEIHFIENFDEALFSTLANPSEEFLKIIFKNMGGKRSTEKQLNQISELVNSISIKNALDKLMEKESKESNTGIITTEEEIKAFNVIKTIMAMSSKFKNSDLERIGFRDFKGSFAILVDDSQTRKICSLILKEKTKSIEINKIKYDLEDTSISCLIKYKKELVESALENLK